MASHLGSPRSVWSIRSVSFVWSNETNQMNQTDEIDQTDLGDIEEWGAAAEAEAQWRHPFETSEISVDHTYPN
jgi:hypothetical protein